VDIRFSDRDLDAAADLLVLGVDSLDSLADLDAAFGSTLISWCKDKKFSGASGSKLSVPSMGRIGAKELLLVGTGSGNNRDLWLATGHAGRAARSAGARRVVVDIANASADVVVQGLCAGNYAYEQYKPEDDRSPAIESLTIVGASSDTARAQALVKYTNWTRDLINKPPADLYPESLADDAENLRDIANVTVDTWDVDELKRNNCVGTIAVGQGSVRAPRMIHIKYRPPGAQAHVALVGKGITFDSGGLSLKPTGGMLAMKCDMGGAATVLGAAGAVAAMGLPINLDVFVASAENMVGANSYKLSDVLHYDNGVTVEIHNTDAEGRLVLADALILASRVDGATHIVDAATLTGACAIATGPDFAGLFTADDGFANELLGHAAGNGDGLWRLPYHLPYKSMLKSDVAQIKNVGGREGGATTAALFLGHFVADDKIWAHLDIAGNSFMDKPHGFYPSGATGEIVRTLYAWMESLSAS